ncbi:YgfZ/GcvT domain-containing protein [Roseomonas sp. CCTCC AB2023176]|uniref:CAF17-like 4Fe-4S cluster assembly/insertion protein YgfZ n=1 Tax=Roseomonas sp. CCTCC AB2023176 TaxID=3342640 RepID=UPI0035DBC6B9
MTVETLAGRGVVEVTGEDRVGFLQGLVSGDVAGPLPVWAALLTPQGKWLADFLIFAEDDRLLLDLPRDDAGLVVERLSRFRLRSKVALRDVSDALTVEAGWDGAPLPAGAWADPRLPHLGWRRVVPRGQATAGEGYDLHRLTFGVPDGTRDLDREKSVLLEGGFDELRGISWTKGCYMGQELTARTRYRGLLKRRLFPVAIEGTAPPRDAVVTLDGREVGEMRSSRADRGLALLRLDTAGAVLTCGDALLRPAVPAWMRLTEAA